MANKKTSNVGKIAAGVAGVAAVAGGAYYFLGKNGKKHRKAALDLAEKAKKQVMAELSKMEQAGSAHYHKASAEVIKQYEKVKSLTPEQLATIKAELKSYWDKASKTLEKVSAQAKPKAKKTASKK